MADTRLRDFIDAAMRSGKSRDEISQALATAGWSREQISDGMRFFADVPFSVPVPRPRAQLSARDAFLYLLMFGTLYVPKGYENLSFGLSNHKGERIEQPYPTLCSALLDPFAESWHALKKGTRWELKAKELADRRSAS